MLKTFYYDMMPSGLQAHYKRIHDEIAEGRGEIIVPFGNQFEMISLMESLLFESPDLFFLELHSINFGIKNERQIMRPTYFHFSEKETVERRIQEVVNEIGKQRTPYEQVLAIVRWMYRLEYVDRKSLEEHTIYAPLMWNTGVCEGFSLLFMLLCRKFRIDAMVVRGKIEGSVDGHAWNVVSLNGRIYNVDLTSAIAMKRAQNIDLYDVLVPDSMMPDHISPDRPYCGVIADNPFYLSGDYFTTLEEFAKKCVEKSSSAREFDLVDLSNDGLPVMAKADSLFLGRVTRFQMAGRFYHFYTY